MLKNNHNVFLAVLLLSGLTVVSSVHADDTTVCEEANRRFVELYPDYQPEPGVEIVKLYKYHFCPKNITVAPNTTVRWVNVDKRTSHSVWLKDAGEAESERFFPEEIWEHTFVKSGPYPYLCGPHWEQENMKGAVHVK